MRISPSFENTDFSDLSSLETKISLFEDSVLGWQINIADQIINGKKSSHGNAEIPPIEHAKYAMLDIIFSYFEMIAKYHRGFKSLGKSREYFRAGVYIVFPDLTHPLQPNHPEVIKEVVDLMYDEIRCGLYHTGRIGSRINVTTESEDFSVTTLRQAKGVIFLTVNPKYVVLKVKEHFEQYISQLKDVSNHQLRMNFEARYDFDHSVWHVLG